MHILSTGKLTAVASWLLLAFIGWTYSPDAYAIVRELCEFFTGGAANVARNHATLLVMIPVLLLVIAVELSLSVASAWITSRVVGEALQTEDPSRDMERLTGQKIFRALFLMVLLEEVFFRWLLLGQLTKLFTSTVAFYVILLASNGLFAVVHLGNYKHENDRRLIRVMPQLITGLFLSFVFVKYGLVASTLAHFAHNAVLYSTFKVQRTNVVDGLLIVLHALFAGIAYSLMDRPVHQAATWFSGEPISKIPDWGFWDYVLLAMFLSACSQLVADVLLFDKDTHPAPQHDNVPNAALVVGVCLIMVMSVGVIYAVYWTLGLVIHDTPLRILVSIITLSSFTKNQSLSSAQRMFWAGIPTGYVGICIMQALGFWGACAYACIMVALAVPQYLLTQFDD